MLPRVILHNAVSADGRVDHFPADIGLYYERAGRWPVDAVLCGADTLLLAPEPIPPEMPDDLAPPPASAGDTRPLLVVPDSRGRIRTWHYWRKLPFWREVLVLVSRATPADYLAYLRERRIAWWTSGDDHVSLRDALAELAEHRGVRTLRVDSGGTLNGVLLRAGLVHEVSLLVHPHLVGGASPRSMYRAEDLAGPEGVLRCRLARCERLRDDVVWLVYETAEGGGTQPEGAVAAEAPR